MKKNVLWFVAVLWLATVLTGCNSKEVWDVDYDLSTEMWRQLHCYAQFQRDHQAKNYWAEWVSEVNNGFGSIVEWKVKADEKEYYLVCNYSDDIADWILNATPIDKWIATGDPASEYCVNQGWIFEIVSNETDIYGECTLTDETKCEEWAYMNGECWTWNAEPEIWHSEFDLQTEEGRLAACEERVGYYLNFNEWTFVWNDESEGWASFVRNWHVTYLKWWENAEDDVECVVDMLDRVVTVEFSNHVYNWELQEERTVTDAPAAKMRVLEWETAEETIARMQEACENMWGEWVDGVCTLEDGSVVAF